MTNTPLTTQQALVELGADPGLLSADERQFIDDNGYLVITNALDSEQIAHIGQRLDNLLEAEGESAGIELHQEPGTDRLASLVDKGAVFRHIYCHPKLLAASAYILDGDIKFSSLSARFARPGEGLQVLHRDYGTVPTPGLWQAVNSIWMLDDFTTDNGATRVVPGSHKWLDTPPAEQRAGAFLSEAEQKAAEHDLQNPARPHPQELIVTGNAGTAVVFNCNLWHSGTLNRTDIRRRGVYSSWVRRDHAQLEPTTTLSAATLAGLSVRGARVARYRRQLI